MRALVLGLLVEEVRKPGEGLRLVMDPDRNVLVGGGELVADLVVQGVDEALGRDGLLFSLAATGSDSIAAMLPGSGAGPRLVAM